MWNIYFISISHDTYFSIAIVKLLGELPAGYPDEMPELSKPGGVSYEFVLEEARAQRAEHPHLKCPATPTPSAEDIERKLKVFSSSSKGIEMSIVCL